MSATPTVAEFRQQARVWLERTAPYRKADSPTAWGEGEFSVVVFHDASDDHEQAVLDQYRAWLHTRIQAGFGAIAVPAEFGGLGLSAAHDTAYHEVEAEFDVPRDHELISVTSKLIAPTIEQFGTAEQRATWCPPFFRLDAYCCQLFSEPGAGSDLANVSTKAVRDGEQWVLDGQKVWTSTARIAQYGFAICRTDPDVAKHAGLTAFLVPLDAPGVDVRPIRQMSGGASFNEVFLGGVRVGDEMRIGEVGQGWAVALAVLGHERVSSGEGRRGGDIDDLVLLARHLGRTADPVVRQELARSYTLHHIREWVRSRATAQAKSTGAPGPAGSLGKLLWTQELTHTSELAGHLLGPALTADTGEWGTFAWNEHLLGAPGYRIAGGTDEIQRNIVGERVLGLPPEPRVDKGISFTQSVQGPRR